jgi:hypothetical protein
MNDRPSIQELFQKFPILQETAVDLIKELPELQVVFKTPEKCPFPIDISKMEDSKKSLEPASNKEQS